MSTIGTVNMEDQVIETKTIDCDAFFYEEGAKDDDFLKKTSFSAPSIQANGKA